MTWITFAFLTIIGWAKRNRALLTDCGLKNCFTFQLHELEVIYLIIVF